MTDAAELIARIRANVDELQTGMQKADDIVKQGASQLNQTAQTTGKNMGNVMGQGFDASLQPAIGQAISRISPALGSIVTAAGPAGMALAAVTAGVVAFKQAWALAEKGAEASELAEKFTKIAGGIQASETMMQKLRSATQGTVADTNLMVAANRAMNMGVTQSAEEMAKLMAIFKDLGEASAMSAQDSIAAGMQALGALQTRGLKTLGLSLDDTKIWDEYAQKLGTTASALDDVQKRAALVQAVLATAPEGLMTSAAGAADKTEAMHVSVENLNIAIGKSIEGMLSLGGAVTKVANSAAAALGRQTYATSESDPYYKRIVDMAQGSEQVYNKLRADVDNLRKAYGEGYYSAEQFNVGLGNLAARAEIYRAYMEGCYSTTEEFVAALRATDPALVTTEAHMALAEQTLGAVAFRAMDAANALRNIPALVQILVEYQEVGPSLGAALGQGVTSPAFSRNIVIADNGNMMGGGVGARSIGAPAKATSIGGGGGGSSSWESEMRQQATELRSLSESLLKPSYRGPDDLVGPYIEQWDEYARKMNAIADDSDTMWRSLVPQDIMAQGQEAIAKWAKAEEKAFYAGQRSGEVNWAKFVEDAKKQVELAQAKEDLIAMGMRKLAEAGIGGVNAAEVLGLNTPGAQIGADAAASFAQGAVGTDVGLSVTTAFGDSITASAKTWESYGAVAMSYFITGGQNGITPETGANLAATLWPYLAKIIGDPTLQKLRASGM